MVQCFKLRSASMDVDFLVLYKVVRKPEIFLHHRAFNSSIENLKSANFIMIQQSYCVCFHPYRVILETLKI